MRMFLIAMCDIFLILYLTGLTTFQQPKTALTVDDFYTLKKMHETLKAEKEKEEGSLQEKLIRQKKEKENLLARQKEQEELAAAREKALLSEKEKLEAKLALEKEKAQGIEKSLDTSNAERERINQDLKEKEEMLKAREQLLANLNKEISAKEEARRKMEASYQKDLKSKQEEIKENRQLAEQLKDKARDAQKLADQMKVEAAQAYKTAEVATNVKQKALILKEEALKDKEAAEKKAKEALAARIKAEAQKKKALEAMEAAKKSRQEAEENAQKLTTTIQDIKQNGKTAYTENILPQVQTLNVTYSRSVTDQTFNYERELTLLPIKLDGRAFVIFPSTQIGFTARSDKAPDELVLLYKGKKISQGFINKDENLIALELPNYKGGVMAPYPYDTPINELMPTLLTLRNNGDMTLMDKIRRISDDYFIVNRDYLKEGKENNILHYDVKGFRGTGMRGDRIILGDQLIDLNGRLIGIANNANYVLRINSLSGWDKIVF